jgi:hypothetical protein
VNKAQELWEELQSVLGGTDVKLLDSLLPAAIFLIANSTLSLPLALVLSIVASLIFFVVRLFQKESFYYALAGLGAVLLAGLFAFITDTAVGYFLPGLISSGLTVMLLLVSTFVKRPLAALTSHLTRGWPLAWYWHPRVRPAYSEVTIFWVVGFGLRLGFEYWLFEQGAVNSLGVIQTILGWPYTILLLILSYLYGIWRLGQLGGPSVEEFKTDASPPWQGQKRGF